MYSFDYINTFDLKTISLGDLLVLIGTWLSEIHHWYQSQLFKNIGGNLLLASIPILTVILLIYLHMSPIQPSTFQNEDYNLRY